ncbi:DUF300-domain-containing protein [Thelephora ganbajun]|uniref:DUF300-domain-containing protein n=1 Tax=Thelephora ganbajun TaxID=370292 RepID=A0ACB6ZSV3_THEGA|nr:DUF300-domain-containing protein [Thelephora ganbajun]
MPRPQCPAEDTAAIEQSSFFNKNGINWTPHTIGWAVAGGCAALTLLITLVSVLKHCRSYTNPPQQRQILRILCMPPVYALIAFFSYRFFREFTYYELVQPKPKAITISAFLLLLIEYVASTASGHEVDKAMARKEKTALPIPLCCMRYRPTKPHFMYTIKWSVLQYVIVRPAASIAGIVCEYYGVLCPSLAWSPYYAQVYISAIDFVSITVALYGLLVFYGLTKDELKGKRPLAKFLAIKLIVFFTFYQSFLFSMLQGRVIHATQYWTEANIANGLKALATCIEASFTFFFCCCDDRRSLTSQMVLFAAFMMWAYPWTEYVVPGRKTSIWRPLWDSINYADFAMEIFGSLKYYFNALRGKPETRATQNHPNLRMDFATAFGVYRPRAETSRQLGVGGSREPDSSYDEAIRLAPYGYQEGASSPDPDTSAGT